jgi:hypothetical protein
MRNVKAKVISVIIGTTGTIGKSLRQYGKHKIKELQTTAIVGAAHTLRRVLM